MSIAAIPSVKPPGFFKSAPHAGGMGIGFHNDHDIPELATVEAFFGPPKTGDVGAWNDAIARDMLVLPDAWRGDNKYVLNVFLDALSTASFHTILRTAAPIQTGIDFTSITIEELHYEATTMDEEPELGVSRTQVKSWRSWTKSMKRYGKNIQMEDGFYMTEKGKQLFSFRVRSWVWVSLIISL